MGSNNISHHTQKINFIGNINKSQIRDILKDICDALEEKGYDPVVQIVGYILSGDPTYITSHKNARSLIGRIERNELLEEILYAYLGKRP
ncbi:MAG: IreB family regulatory phosphoprotein [Defluviitaleaceae bacterium]|nr:IreB family regulatory phosphoprotein [Defluviitaleaceae bacterium]